jgi:hypothetical protein
MTNKITENTIEEFVIELLEHFGYQYVYRQIKSIGVY